MDMFRSKYYNEKGDSLVEYALLIGLIAVVAVVAITSVGTNSEEVFSEVAVGVNDGAVNVNNINNPIAPTADTNPQFNSSGNMRSNQTTYAPGTPITIDYGLVTAGNTNDWLFLTPGADQAANLQSQYTPITSRWQYNFPLGDTAGSKTFDGNATTEYVIQVADLPPGDYKIWLMNAWTAKDFIEFEIIDDFTYDGPTQAQIVNGVWTDKDTYLVGEEIETGMMGHNDAADWWFITPKSDPPNQGNHQPITSRMKYINNVPTPGFFDNLVASDKQGDIWPLPPGEWTINSMHNGWNIVATQDFTVIPTLGYSSPTQAHLLHGVWTDKDNYAVGEEIVIGMYGNDDNNDWWIITPTGQVPSHGNPVRDRWFHPIGTGGLYFANASTSYGDTWPLPAGNWTLNSMNKDAWTVADTYDFTIS